MSTSGTVFWLPTTPLLGDGLGVQRARTAGTISNRPARPRDEVRRAVMSRSGAGEFIWPFPFEHERSGRENACGRCLTRAIPRACGRSEQAAQFVGVSVRVAQDAGKRAALELPMERHHQRNGTIRMLEANVAAALAGRNPAELPGLR